MDTVECASSWNGVEFWYTTDQKKSNNRHRIRALVISGWWGRCTCMRKHGECRRLRGAERSVFLVDTIHRRRWRRFFGIVERTANVAEAEVGREAGVRIAFGYSLFRNEDREGSAEIPRGHSLFSSKRTGDSRSRSSGGISNLLGERGENNTIILPSLICESEKCEEDERADGDCPSGQLDVDDDRRVRLPNQSRELTDVTEVVVGIRPRNPFVDAGFWSAVRHHVLINPVASPRDCEEQINAR